MIQNVKKSHDFAALRTLRTMSGTVVMQDSSCVVHVAQISMNGIVGNSDFGLRL